MSTLGKVLLVFNLLLGGGFAYLALQDWKGRQEITAAGFRHVVLLDGLPLGAKPGDPEAMPTDPEAEIPFVIEGPGGKPTETVGPAVLKAYFTPAAGAMDTGSAPLAVADPVHSQLAEVRRVLGVVKTYLETQADDAKKAQAAHNLLILQAETLDERQQTQALLAAGKGDELRDRLYARFERVLKAPAQADTSALAVPEAEVEAADKTKERLTKAGEVREGTKDEPERRARLSHLLVHLDPSAAWQKRVMMVVGVKRYVRTVAVQGARFAEMATRVRRLTDDDQNRFAGTYAQLREMATRGTQLLNELTDREVRLQDVERRDADAVAKLETQLNDPTTGLKAQLAQVKADVDTLLAKQELTERELFRVQRIVADTLDDVYRMEAELARVERERYGKK